MPLILNGTDSSATTPALQGGTGGTTTGQYFPAINVWGVSTNGSERLRVDASGNMGIGTSSPVNKLQVAGAVVATGAAAAYAAGMTIIDYASGVSALTAIGPDTSTVGTTIFQSFSSNASLGGERMRIDSSGNVGIGTASPGCKLDIIGASNTSLSPTVRVYSANVAVNSALAYDGLVGSGEFTLQTSSAVPLKFGTNATERMRIDSSGNVGIGTTSTPTGSSAGSRFITVAGSGDGVLQLTRTGATAGGAAIAAASGPGMLFYTHTGTVGSETYTERMRIDSSGFVGIGQTAPISFLDIYGNGAYTYSRYWRSDQAGYGARFGTADTLMGSAPARSAGVDGFSAVVFGIAGTEKMRIDSSGNVGIGNAAPDRKLYIAGGARTGSLVSNIFAISDGAIYTFDIPISTSEVSLRTNLNNLSFQTVNSERMRIDSSGNLLVGTTSSNIGGQPINGVGVAGAGGALLALNNSNNTNQAWNHWIYDSGLGAAGTYSIGQIINGSTGGVAGGPFTPIFNMAVPSAASNSPKVFINASGNVGIGTTSPAYRLDVGTGSVSGNIHSYGSITSGTLAGYSIRGVPRLTNDTGTFENTYIGCGASVGNIIFQQGNSFTTASNTERMRITSSGQLLVGTTSSDGKIAVVASGATFPLIRAQSDSPTSSGVYGQFNAKYGGTDRDWFFGQASDGSFSFWDYTPGVTNRLTITTGGNLQFNSGYGSVAIAYGCRAWCQYNQSPTIIGSGNITSISVITTGDVRLNFATALVDANYSAVATTNESGGGPKWCNSTQPSTVNVRIVTFNADQSKGWFEYNSVAVFR